jgi:uncharacterized membrane protein
VGLTIIPKGLTNRLLLVAAVFLVALVAGSFLPSAHANTVAKQASPPYPQLTYSAIVTTSPCLVYSDGSGSCAYVTQGTNSFSGQLYTDSQGDDGEFSTLYQTDASPCPQNGQFTVNCPSGMTDPVVDGSVCCNMFADVNLLGTLSGSGSTKSPGFGSSLIVVYFDVYESKTWTYCVSGQCYPEPYWSKLQEITAFGCAQQADTSYLGLIGLPLCSGTTPEASYTLSASGRLIVSEAPPDGTGHYYLLAVDVLDESFTGTGTPYCDPPDCAAGGAYGVSDFYTNGQHADLLDYGFIQSSNPNAPTPYSPANNAITGSASTMFTWTPASDPWPNLSYTLQVSTDSTFKTNVQTYNIPSTNYPNNNYYTVTLSQGTYYWRVSETAGNGLTSQYSQAYTLTVDLTPPTAPTLISPVNNLLTNNNQPTLSWNPSTDDTGVAYYVAELSTSSTFSNALVSVPSGTSVVAPQLADGTWYWQVQAVDDGGNPGPWSPTWSFTVDTSPPSTPVLQSPSNGAVSTSTSQTLTWAAATDDHGVASYNLQVDTSTSFNSPNLISRTGITSTSYTVTLSPGIWYWRVQAVDNAGNTGSWSSYYTLSIADFTVSSTSMPAIDVWSSGQSTVTVASEYSFTGTLNLSASITGPCSGSNCPTVSLPSSVSLTSSVTSAQLTLQVFTISTTPAGLYTVTVTATSGQLQHQITVSVTVADFSISASPTALTSVAGGSSGSTLSLQSIGFTGSVSLTISMTPPSGVNCSTSNCPTISLSTNPVSLSNGGTATVSLSTQSSTSTPVGVYTITVTATSGSLTHQTSLTLTIQDFSIVASSPSAVIVGSSVGSTITVTALNGFNGPVSLTDTVPAGLTCGALIPSTVTGSGTASFPCSATVAGTYTVTITGTSGSLVHSTTATFTYVDFSFTASQNSQFYTTGPAVSSNVVASGLSGFTGTVGLSLSISPSTGLNCILSPLSLSLSTTTTTATAVLSCSGSPGLYTVTITGTSGSLTHTLTLPYTFFSQTMTFAGVTATVNGVFTRPNPTARSLYGTTTLTETNSSSGARITSSTVSMSIFSSDNVTSEFVAETPNAPYWLGVFCKVELNAASSCSLSRTPDVIYAGSGLVNINDVSFVDAKYNSYPSSPNWDPRADLAAQGTVNIVDVSIESADYNAQVFLMNSSILSLAAQSSHLVFQTGSSASTTITVYSAYWWSGTFNLIASVSPSGPSCSLNPTSGTLTADGTITSTLTCSASTPGTYSLTVSGSNSAGLGNFVEVHLNVTDFNISTSPNSLSFTVGTSGSASLSLSLASLYGFSGTVSLSSTTIPGITVSCPSSVSISPGPPISAGCTVNASSSVASGTYTITITGTSGPVSHSAAVIIYVMDFSISASGSIDTYAGPNGNGSLGSTLTVSSVDGFAGTISLTATPPSGFTTSFSASSLTLTSGGTATSNIWAYPTSSSTSPGTYSFTVTATSGSLTHQVTVSVVYVGDFGMSSSPTSLTLYQGGSGTVAISVTSQYGFSGNVALSTSAPSGISTSLNVYQTNVSPSTPGSATLSVTVSASQPAGTYNVCVYGSFFFDRYGVGQETCVTITVPSSGGGSGGGGGGGGGPPKPVIVGQETSSRPEFPS